MTFEIYLYGDMEANNIRLTKIWIIFVIFTYCKGLENSELTEDSICPHYMFSCGGVNSTKYNSRLCVYPWMVCDGLIHCPNKADEYPRVADCQGYRSKFKFKSPATQESCLPPLRFPCGIDSTCIQASQLCDGVKDCRDASDEMEKACKLKDEIDKFVVYAPTTDSYKCLLSKELIPLRKFCDGKEDCTDTTDEGVFCQSKGCARVKDVCPSSKCFDTLLRPVCECGAHAFFNPFLGYCQETIPCLFHTCEHSCEAENSTNNTDHMCRCRDGYNLVDKHKCIVKGEIKIIAQKKSGATMVIGDSLEGGVRTIESQGSNKARGGTIRGVDLENDTLCYSKGTIFNEMICSKISNFSSTWIHTWLMPSRISIFAYDWISKNWYFPMSFGRVVISTYDLNSFNSTQIYVQPNAILIDPLDGYIFLVTSKEILQTSLDLVAPKRSLVQIPGLKLASLSIEQKSIFFTEVDKSTIKKVTYPHGRVTTVLDELWVRDTTQMSILDNHLYFTTTTKDGSFVKRIKMSQPKLHLPLSNSSHLNRFVLLHEVLQPQLAGGKEPCISNCAQLCLRQFDDRLNNFRCSCFPSTTKKTCHEKYPDFNTPFPPPISIPPSSGPHIPTPDDGDDDEHCSNNSFTCKNRFCIDSRWLCDGWDDCGDNSDEDDPSCRNKTCPVDTMFKCKDNICIYKKWLCDGEDDCTKGEDEDPSACSVEIKCSNNYTKCTNDSRCIRNDWLCDGEFDCEDGMDEENCTISQPTMSICKPSDFPCTTPAPKCIDKTLVCNDRVDCPDGSDEMFCKSTITVNGDDNAADGDDDDDRDGCNPASKFLCAKTKKCIPKLNVCDGSADCGSNDYSDEYNCTGGFLCLDNPAYFQCNNSFCISSFHKCDGFNDCGDLSDEVDCGNKSMACSKDQFKCSNNKCIPERWRCDEADDCSDDSDEADCDPLVHCLPPNMPCGSRCLPLNLICDGQKDCPDGEDEGGLCEKNLCKTANCSHFCGNTPQGFQCTCPLHLSLDRNNKTCTREPICHAWGICSQKCEEVGQLHKCSCYEGYTLQHDMFTCLPDDARKMSLIFSNRHELRQLDLNLHTFKILIGGQRNVIALNFFYNHTEKGHDSFLFWNDVVEDKIYRGTMGSSVLNDVEPIVKRGLMTTEGLAVDWVTEHIYWVESTLDQIEVSDFSGNQRLTVVSQGLTNPRGVAVDPIHGYLFWTDWDPSLPRIERSNMDGEDRKILFDVSTIGGSGWPNGLTTDFEMERLYWVDARSDSIHSIDYDGGDEREIIRGHDSLSHPFAISIFGNNIYWSDWRTNTIYSANKWNGTDLKVVERTVTQPFDIRIFHPKVQKPIPNPCKNDTCGKGGVCLLTTNRRTSCKCPLLTHMVDGNCELVDKMLLILRASDLRCIYLNDPSKNAMATIVLQEHKATDMDYDTLSGEIFIGVMGNLASGILTSDMVGSDVKVMDVASQRVRNLAYDWMSGLLYKSVSLISEGQIMVSRSDGTFRARLDIPEEFTKNPASLIIHPPLGLMFWIDMANTRIVQARMDGSETKTIFSLDDDEDLNSENVTQLQNLCINSTDSRLWWVINHTSSSSSSIVHCPVGKAMECKPTTFDPKKKLRQITALLIDERTVYFASSSSENLIEAVDVDGSNAKVLKQNIANVISLKMFHRGRRPTDNKCLHDNGRCSHLCVPNIPEDSRSCLCAVGFFLDAKDKMTCRDHRDFLLYSKGPEIAGVMREGNNSSIAKEVFPSISGVKYVASLDFVHDEDLIVYMDNLAREITSIKRDLTKRKVIMATGITGSEYITVDWIAKNLYWTDAMHDYIYVSRLDGSHRIIVIHDIQKPFDIVVDPINGYLYWSEILKERSTHSSLKRSRLDGSEVMAVIPVGSKRQPAHSLTFDAHTNRLYWFDISSNLIFYFDTLKSPDEGIVEMMLVPSCLGIAVFGQHIYWPLQNGTVMRASATPYPNDTEVYLNRLPSPITDIKWFTKQKGSTRNPCQSKNGGCEQLCLFNGTLPVCRCSHGKVVNITKCQAHQVFLAYSKVSSIETMSLEKTPYDDGFDPNPLYPSISDKKTMVNVIGLTYDPDNSRYFYSDIHLEKISAVNYDGSNVETVVRDVGSVEGLTYDPLVQELYWTSYTLVSIFKVSLKGQQTDRSTRTGTRIVQLMSGDHPRSIAHETCFSTLYWTNWNPNKPSIMSSSADGSSLRYIITTDIKTPNSITIDRDRRKLFWSDAKLDKIEECNVDGSNRKIILSDYPQHSFGLAIHEDFLYWTDWLLMAVIRLDVGKGRTKIVKNLKYIQPMGVVVVTDEKVDCSANPCYRDNGGCQDKCSTNAFNRRICSCSEGSYLSLDGTSCLKARSCGELLFQCHDDMSCIDYHLECDGKNDCKDGSDEVFCASCPQGKFKCWSNDTCIDLSMRCDGIKDCEDASDEKVCPPNKGCVAPQVACNRTTACIKHSNLCDGANDCWDLEDEEDCDKLHCTKGFTSCSETLKCIPNMNWCDGVKDCTDGSDETECRTKECPEDHFHCDNYCLHDFFKCDGFQNCIDKADEEDCGDMSNKCSLQGFKKCPESDQCIPFVSFCNGVNDCPNGTDELPSLCNFHLCKPDEFMCSDKECIPRSFVCDGEDDCVGGSDELFQFCVHKEECKADEFKCASENKCIPLEKKCNGKINCKDHSDEDVNICSTPPLCSDRTEFFCSFSGNDGRKKTRKDEKSKKDKIDDESDYLMGGVSKCINMEAFCRNGSIQCSDGQDELRRSMCGIKSCTTSNGPACEQICEQHVIGHKCRCTTGYQLNDDHMTCSDINECDRYICGQHCTNLIGSYKCYCSNNFTLASDGVSCKADSDVEARLLMSNRYYIRSMSLDGLINDILVPDLQNAVALDFDWREQMLYWSDVTRSGSNITRMRIDGSMKSIVHTSPLRSLDGIAVDWIGRNLYWCDKSKDTIEVTKLDGRFRKVLIRTDLHEPRAIVLHPFRGLMFYSDWGDNPHIGRSGMDGSGRTIIIKSDILGWPNALAVDLIADRLWWVDAKLDYIAVSGIDGSNMRYIIRDQLPHVFSLAMFEDYIYWADWDYKSIERAHKLTGAKRDNLTYTLDRPMAIQIFHPFTKPEQISKDYVNPCLQDGNCPTGSLCLIREGGSEKACMCPERHYLSEDGTRCIGNCTSSEFLCATTYKCIPFWWRCDGQNDCGDYSDEPENSCPPYHCKFPGMFQCNNATSSQHCHIATRICDGEKNCEDGSDEIDCDKYTCMESQFKCEDRCIQQLSRCNGFNDCKNGEDEKDCPESICPKNHFQCKNSRCVPLVWKCDGENDCSDNSDEPPDCATHVCPSGYLKCLITGKCVPETWKCDGDFDCGENDPTDESPEICHNVTCPGTYFKCKNNRCILGVWRCDFEDDCKDGSDEEECAPRVCMDVEFQCLNIQQCIPNFQRCDGMVQCNDGTDESKCDEIVECEGDSFKCNTSGLCIPKHWVCDRAHDCLDGSDEMNCHKNFSVPCNSYEKACNDGQCIPSAWWCDGMDDCVDESDEETSYCNMAPCSPGYFQCASKTCILKEFICDGLNQCPGGSDELGCPSKICTSGEFQCLNHKCIDTELVCNGMNDCMDGSDEDIILCREYNTNCSSVDDCSLPFVCKKFLEGSPASPGHMFFSQKCTCPKHHTSYNFITDKCEQGGAKEYCSHPDLCPQCFADLCQCGEGLVPLKDQGCAVSGHGRMIINSDGRLFSLDDVFHGHAVRRFPKENIYPVADSIVRTLKITSIDFGNMTQFSETDFHIDLYFISQSDSILHKMNVHVNESSKVDDSSFDDIPLKVAQLENADDIAIDWVANHVYWIDASSNKILMSDMSGSKVITIIDTNLHIPLAVAVDPLTKTLCWTIVGFHARIECSNLNGSQRRSLVDSKVIWPTDLVFDSRFNRIFWVDMKKQTVESIRLDGQSRRTVWTFQRTNSSHLNLPFRIDIMADFLYVLLHRPCKIMTIYKFGTHRSFKPRIFPCHSEVDDLVLVHRTKRIKFNTTSACMQRECSENSLCFDLPSGPTCQCINGLEATIEGCRFKSGTGDPCNDYCHHDGICVLTELNQPKCSCKPGFSGTRCDLDVCFGFCVEDRTTQPCHVDNRGHQMCSCKAEYDGPRCEHSKCDDVCLNSGTCSYNPVINATSCQCRPGHIGHRCELRSNDTCQSFQCHNEGKCFVDSDQRALCNCPSKYTGKHCEKCRSPLKNDAPITCGPCYHTCTNDSLSSCQISVCHTHPHTSCHFLSPTSNEFKCICPLGFRPLCPQVVEVVTKVMEVSSQKRRRSFQERYPPAQNIYNYYDELESDIYEENDNDDGDDDVDSNSEKILQSSSECFRCVDTCFSFSCMNEGKCRHHGSTFEPYCHCQGPYRGKTCHIPCSSCFSSGTKNCLIGEDEEEKCECKDGYRGKNCGGCDDGYCSSRGTCNVTHDGDVSCECNLGYKGRSCDEEVGCSLVNCQNNGTCQPDVNNQSYYCLCPDGVSGELCQYLSAGSNTTSAILTSLFIMFVVALVVLVSIFIFKRSRNQFRHKRMVENGMNMEISNPMYTNDEEDDDDRRYVTLGCNSSVNFTSPSYSQRHESSSSVTIPQSSDVNTSETVQLLESSKELASC